MTMTIGLRFLVTGLAALAPFAAAAQDKPCTPADEKKAEQTADRVSSWDQLYKAWQDYRQCDKGNVDEVFTDALLRLMVDWKNVDRIAASVEKDRDYRDFVHRHLNSPAAKPDLDAVYSRAKMSCPKGLVNCCKDITMTAKPFAGMEMIQAADPTKAAPAAPAPSAAPPKK